MSHIKWFFVFIKLEIHRFFAYFKWKSIMVSNLIKLHQFNKLSLGHSLCMLIYWLFHDFVQPSYLLFRPFFIQWHEFLFSSGQRTLMCKCNKHDLVMCNEMLDNWTGFFPLSRLDNINDFRSFKVVIKHNPACIRFFAFEFVILLLLCSSINDKFRRINHILVRRYTYIWFNQKVRKLKEIFFVHFSSFWKSSINLLCRSEGNMSSPNITRSFFKFEVVKVHNFSYVTSF